MINLLAIVGIFLLFSLLGYFAEYINECYIDSCEFHSSFLTSPLPLLPIYGIGAVILWLLTPYLMKYNIAIQFIIIVIVLTAFEYLSGYLRKRLTGNHSWQYSNGSVIDIKHSILWGIGGVVLLHLFNLAQKYV